MPAFKKLTPNLMVTSVERSLAFYIDVLGFARGMTVPDASPFVFASVTSGSVEVFLNDLEVARNEYPTLASQSVGLSGTLFIEVDGVDALHERLADRVTVVMPLITQWYGVREFAINDPDGYVITFAERV